MLLRRVSAICLPAMFLTPLVAVFPATAQSILPGGKLVVPKSDLYQLVKSKRKDRRRPVPEKYDGLGIGVGLLVNRSNNAHCTAFCVGKDLIASNAHCLEWHPKRKQRNDLSYMVFHILADGDVLGQSRLKWNNVGNPDQPRLSLLTEGIEGTGRWKFAYKDWAVARLEHDICEPVVLKFARPKLLKNTRLLRRSPIFMIGFHGDLLKKHKRRSYVECKFQGFSRRAGRRVAQHSCYGKQGSSGSPILIHTAEGPRVVAINVGTRRGRKYRRLPNGRTKTISRWTTFAAVIPTRLVERLERFSGSHYVNDEMSLVEFQKRLKQAGYFRGRTSKGYISKTRKAIFRMERAKKLTPLGIPTQELLVELNQLQSQ